MKTTNGGNLWRHEGDRVLLLVGGGEVPLTLADLKAMALELTAPDEFPHPNDPD